MNEISVLLLSGALGLINFWILREMDLIVFFDTKDEDEKRQFIVILGIINFFVYQVLQDVGWEWLESQNNNLKYYLLTFLVATILEIIICFSMSKIVIRSNKKKQEKGKTINLYINTLDKILEGYEGEDLYTYIFDFENKLIDHGYIRNFSTKDPEFNLSLRKKAGHSEAITSYEEFIKITDYTEVEVLCYVDFKYKIKMYCFVN